MGSLDVQLLLNLKVDELVQVPFNVLNQFEFEYLKNHTRCDKFVDMLYFLNKDVDKMGQQKVSGE